LIFFALEADDSPLVLCMTFLPFFCPLALPSLQSPQAAACFGAYPGTEIHFSLRCIRVRSTVPGVGSWADKRRSRDMARATEILAKRSQRKTPPEGQNTDFLLKPMPSI